MFWLKNSFNPYILKKSQDTPNIKYIMFLPLIFLSFYNNHLVTIFLGKIMKKMLIKEIKFM